MHPFQPLADWQNVNLLVLISITMKIQHLNPLFSTLNPQKNTQKELYIRNIVLLLAKFFGVKNQITQCRNKEKTITTRRG